MSKHLFKILIILLMTCHMAMGQDFTKHQLRLIEDGDYYFELTDYIHAKHYYQKVFDEDSTSAKLNFKIGVCIYNLSGNKKVEAVRYFEFAADKEYAESYYYLALCYRLQMKLEGAIELFQKYKNTPGEKVIEPVEVLRQIEITDHAKKLSKSPISVNIQNLGKKVNSEYSDYVPLISADESKMIFTSRRKGSTGGKKDPYQKYFEDIYITNKVDSQWTDAVKINGKINTSTNDACVGLSADGTTLIIFRTNKDLVGGDLYWSHLEGDTWGDPEMLGKHINTMYRELSASLSAQSNVMYFSSNRPGGYGGLDIYRVIKFNDEWSLPQNLGPAINTPFDEDAPFIHPDGKTLYFSSKGHATMGGYDVFTSHKTDEGLWSEPTNIGYPINTVGHDIYFVLSADGHRGYYSSGKDGGLGGQDIYVANFVTQAKSLTILKGQVFAGVNQSNPIRAKITMIDEYDKVQGIYKSNKLSGKFLIILHPGKRYRLLIEADGHQPATHVIEEADSKGFMEISRNFNLKVKTD